MLKILHVSDLRRQDKDADTVLGALSDNTRRLYDLIMVGLFAGQSAPDLFYEESVRQLFSPSLGSKGHLLAGMGFSEQEITSDELQKVKERILMVFPGPITDRIFQKVNVDGDDDELD